MNILMKLAITMMVSLLSVSILWAGEQEHSGHSSHDAMNKKSTTDAMKMDMSKDDDMKHKSNHDMNHGDHKGMKMSMPMMNMSGNKGAKAQGGSAPPNARDPHAYSGGYKRDPLKRLVLADELMFYSLLVDRMEIAKRDGATSETFDMQAWVGYDYNRLVVKLEGDIVDKNLEETSSELLWGHAISTFWDTQLGVRYDRADGEGNSWLALGVQGLAPYWFEFDTTFYVGDNFQTSLAVDAEYELLITQKLILQPRFAGTLYSKSDTAKGIGSGLSDMSVGIRLRYEFRREFAPYIGVEWVGKFGNTADLVSASGGSTSENLLVAGLRFWF